MIRETNLSRLAFLNLFFIESVAADMFWGALSLWPRKYPREEGWQGRQRGDLEETHANFTLSAVLWAEDVLPLTDPGKVPRQPPAERNVKVPLASFQYSNPKM